MIGYGPVQSRSFSSLETGPSNTSCAAFCCALVIIELEEVCGVHTPRAPLTFARSILTESRSILLCETPEIDGPSEGESGEVVSPGAAGAEVQVLDLGQLPICKIGAEGYEDHQCSHPNMLPIPICSQIPLLQTRSINKQPHLGMDNTFSAKAEHRGQSRCRYGITLALILASTAETRSDLHQ